MAEKEAIVLEMKEADEVTSDPISLSNNAYHRAVIKLQTKAANFWNLNGVLAKKITIAVLVALYFVYLGFAISYRYCFNILPNFYSKSSSSLLSLCVPSSCICL